MVRSLEEALREFEAKIAERRAKLNGGAARPAARSCQAYRSADQWLCPCGLSCDTHDEAPPMCPTTGLQIGLKRVG